jgi:hypothetical protein
MRDHEDVFHLAIPSLADPSNNLLEFKHYDDPRMMY